MHSIQSVIMDGRYVALVGGGIGMDASDAVEAIELLEDGTQLADQVTPMPNLCYTRKGHAAANIRGRILVCGGNHGVDLMEMFISENDRFQRGPRAYAGWSPRGQWSLLTSAPKHFTQEALSAKYHGDLLFVSSN